MKRILTLPVAALALTLTGCGDDASLTAPESANDDLNRGGAATGLATVVHGVPGLVVDVYVNGALQLPSFVPGTVTDPLELPEGDYDLSIVPEGGIFPDDEVLTASTFLPAGANASIVAHLLEDGTPNISVFVNDTSPTRGIRSRVVLRHLAEAPTVDVRMFRRLLPWWPWLTVREVSNLDEAQADIFPGLLRAKLYPTGSRDAVFSTDYVPFFPNESTIVYAIGSLGDGTFDVLVQKIPLSRGYSSEALRDGTDAIPADLPIERYDEIAVERSLRPETAEVDAR